MPIEKELLKDLIESSPIDSTWQISSDSWEGLKVLLKDVCSTDELHIKVFITETTRNEVLKLIDSYPFQDWIIHQSIINSLDECIMNSYDHMTTILISQSFPDSEKLLLKYQNADLLYIK